MNEKIARVERERDLEVQLCCESAQEAARGRVDLEARIEMMQIEMQILRDESNGMNFGT